MSDQNVLFAQYLFGYSWMCVWVNAHLLDGDLRQDIVFVWEKRPFLSHTICVCVKCSLELLYFFFLSYLFFLINPWWHPLFSFDFSSMTVPSTMLDSVSTLHLFPPEKIYILSSSLSFSIDHSFFITKWWFVMGGERKGRIK